MTIVSICTLALATLAPTATTQQMSVCIQVLQASEQRGLPPSLVAALSWHESRFHDDRTSRVGAVGPLQVLPKYWCKTTPCDHIEAGLDALQWYIKKTSTYLHAVCRYNAGTCKKSSSPWSRKVMRTARFFSRTILSLSSSYPTSHQGTTVPHQISTSASF